MGREIPSGRRQSPPAEVASREAKTEEEEEVDYESLLSLSQAHKREGDALYGSKSYTAAGAKYEESLRVLERADKVRGGDRRKSDIMRGFLYLNLAACHEKEGSAAVAVLMCTYALSIDGKNAKALQKRALCSAEMGEHAHAYRDCLALGDLVRALPEDIKALVAETRESRPEVVAEIDAERRELSVLFCGGFFGRAYLIVHAAALTLGWWVVVVLLAAELIAWGGAANLAAAKINIGWVLSALQLGGMLDVLHAAMGLGLRGQRLAGDSLLSLAFRQGFTLALYHLVYVNYEDMYRSQSLTLCIAAWAMAGLLRYPARLTLFLVCGQLTMYCNQHSVTFLSKLINISFLVSQPVHLLVEYVAIWTAIPVVEAAYPTVDKNLAQGLHFFRFAYPVIAVFFYHQAIRTWSRPKVEKRQAVKLGKKL